MTREELEYGKKKLSEILYWNYGTWTKLPLDYLNNGRIVGDKFVTLHGISFNIANLKFKNQPII